MYFNKMLGNVLEVTVLGKDPVVSSSVSIKDEECLYQLSHYQLLKNNCCIELVVT
jgi:hypothetical protein